jgi:MATE family multidrug resistance protein
LSDGFQVTGQSALRGLADVRIPTVITFLAYWVVGLPLGYWLGIVQQWGVAGVWTGLVAGLSTAAIMLTVRFHRKTRITDTAPVRAERPSFNT